MSIRNTALVALAAAVLPTLPQPASAQNPGVTWQTETRFEFAGAMGTLMGAFGGQEPQIRQTWMLDGVHRTDDGETGSILRAADGTYTSIDHGARTWFTMTFEEMMAAAEQAMAEATAGASGAPGGGATGSADPDQPEIQADFRFDVDRRGDRRDFGEWEAERVVLTMYMEMRAETDEGEMQDAGEIVLVNDLWLSRDFPSEDALMAEAMSGAGGAWIEQMRASGRDMVAQVTAANPRVGAALERMQEEMEGLEGVAMESHAYVVSALPGAEWETDEVLALNDAPLSEGLGSVMGDAAGDAARDAAADAARSAMGRFGGLFGGGDDEEEEPEEPAPPAWSVLTRVTTRLIDARIGSFGAEVFEIDSSYTERRPDWLGGN